MSDRIKRIAVTGASGLLGTELLRALRGSYELLPFSYRREGQAMGLKFRRLDLRMGSTLLNELARFAPDLVIHAAAMTAVDTCEQQPTAAYQANVAATRNVCLAARAIGVPVVYYSTDFVFDGRARKPMRENHTPSPIGMYGWTKWMGERAVARLPKHLTIRTSWLFGEHGVNFVAAILKQAEYKKELHVVDDQRGCPTYAPDLAAATRTLLGLGATGTYHVCNAGECSWCGFAREIIRLSGKRVTVKAIPTRDLDRPAERPRYSVLSTEKYERATGDALRPWQDALRDYITGENHGKNDSS